MQDIVMVVLRERAQLRQEWIDRARVLLQLGIGNGAMDYMRARSESQPQLKNLWHSSYSYIARSGPARHC